MKKILLTGFDPFDGEAINPAWEAVKDFEDRTYENIQVFVKQIPTVFYRSLDVLREAIEEVQPDIVICVGQAGGRPDFTVERVAINIDDARIADNEGNQPVDEPIILNGPVAYWSTLPIKVIVQQVREAGIPASVSHTAGTFVCNHLFYGLQHLIATQSHNIRGGFVHIPYLPEQAARFPQQPSMSIEQVSKALDITIKYSVAYESDIKAIEGQIS
ncbi:pyroglutamyl-peptidase I [Brevibacillus daliensis]|uniref:pyroglutamyl-peptidase I n=1 Tax=Brevibacillus daliensis TaxID=2892995 RepID=UPI001E52A726|nr:pyroglutamyl-peptidase I [Brevibacillus daliensis]